MTRTIERAGQDGSARFRWSERGTGEPVLLMHGLLGERAHWAASLEALAGCCRPMALALPIFEPWLAETSPMELSACVRTFLDSQGISQAVIGGNSLGGHVALELTLAHPDRVSGLILTGSSGLFERSFTQGVPHRPDSRWVREKMQEIFFDPGIVTAEWVESVQRLLSDRDSVLRLLQAARAAKRRNIEAHLPAIRVPTCLIWGEDDRITPLDVAWRFHALIPRSNWKRAAALQEATLLRMVATARHTEFGRAHGFHAIGSVAAYQERVPLRTYLEFGPLWARAASGTSDVTWPGRPRHWVKTFGTTAGDKYIPVTPEAHASHRKGGWDAFLLAAERVGGAALLDGPLLFLGGSTALTPYGNGCLLGDLSGLVIRRLPPVIRSRYAPGPDIAALSDWERRISAIASQAASQDLRLLSGMPSWMVILFERVAQARQETGRPVRTLRQCWPNLKVFIHGGVAFAPYLKVFEDWMGGPLPRIEVYPASEGFVAVQTEESGGLTLMLDYGIFYEFVPVEDLGRDTPRRHSVATLEMNRPYAIVLTAPAGLWSYILGDTVRFVAHDPLRLQIVGRIRHFVNAFGENVIVEEVEHALARACHLTQADVVEFTVAPRYPSQAEARGGHEWLIEFRRTPSDLADFGRLLDETLAELNHDYHTKRTGAVGMISPQVTPLPPRTFYRWMRKHGKLGDQHKVPRVTNDRTVAESLLVEACVNEHTPRRQVPAEV